MIRRLPAPQGEDSDKAAAVLIGRTHTKSLMYLVGAPDRITR